MDTFWSLVRESVVVQGVLTVGIWGTIIYLTVVERSVPDILSAGGMGILGFWFGTKVQAKIEATRRAEG